MKWLPVALLVIIGVLAAIVAGIYLTVPIHSLPSFMPGHHSGRGIYHKRGAVAALVAVVALVAAGGLAVYFRRPGSPQAASGQRAAPGATSASAEDLL